MFLNKDCILNSFHSLLIREFNSVEGWREVKKEDLARHGKKVASMGR